MWGGVEYEIQYQDCDDFYNWGGGGGGGGGRWQLEDVE